MRKNILYKGFYIKEKNIIYNLTIYNSLKSNRIVGESQYKQVSNIDYYINKIRHNIVQGN